MEKWESVLSQFLKESYHLLKDTKWMIMGSMATTLQGCHIIPNDMDIIMQHKEDVYLLTSIMEKYMHDDDSLEAIHTNDNWQSTRKHPVTEDEYDKKKDCWTFARWYMDDFKIECANIIPPEDYLRNKKDIDGIWEGGPEIWKYKKFISFDDFMVPVVPLEIQLETNLRRNYQLRIEEIIRQFKRNSYDIELLNDCLSKTNKEKVKDLIRK